VGVLRYAHEMSTDVALLSGSTIALYGFSLLVGAKRWWEAGLWLGVGTGVTLLAKGFFVPAMLGGAGIVLLLLMPSVRSRGTLYAIGCAVLAILPFLLWPLLLYLHSPALF